MEEQLFYQAINEKAQQFGINPLLLISGIEGLYTFKDIQINMINYEVLDSLILTIFALRIGDRFHALAEENLKSSRNEVRLAAAKELTEIGSGEIDRSSNTYLQSFARMLGGKSPIRGYHEKALEVAALEIKMAQERYQISNISFIIMEVCKSELQGRFDLDSLFAS